MGHWLSAAFASYGYAVVVVGIFFEGCGLPLPGETVLLAGGFFARQGALSLKWLIPLAFCAAVAGDNTGYWIGRRGGRAFVVRHGRWVGLTPKRLESVDSFFARHGAKTIVAARFLSGVRAFAPLFAGLSGIPWRRFAAFNAAACLLWSLAIGLLGYGFGESWGRAEHVIGRAGLSVLVVAAGLILLAVVRRHRERVLLWVRESLPERMTQRELWMLAVELMVLGTLARLAGRVVAHRATRFDARWADRLAAWAGPATDRILAACAALASAPAALAVALLAAGWFWRRRRRPEALVILSMYFVSLALTVDLSRALAWWTGTLGLFSGLLSGNALVAVTAYGLVALLLTRRLPHWRWPAALAAGALALLIAWARVNCELDLPSGVLAGLAVSSLLLVLATYLLERFDVAATSAVAPAAAAPAVPASRDASAAPPGPAP
jgi:membrane protein DedA with SNARE-associated domain